MAFRDIEQVLNRSMGLDAASIGAPAVARAVEARMSANQLAQPVDYLMRLQSSAEELQALVEAVVVPETWFFRNPQAFNAVAALAARHWLVDPARPPMRLLSAPCSTGEEPYSLAMTLIDAGLPPARFSIEGIDISEQALGRARAGIYSKNSFRDADVEYRARHFAPAAEGFRIGEGARARVQFRQTNVLALEGAGGAYDVIFCRNLLIYFDPETQARVIAALRGLLAPDGLMFVGPGEANLMLGAAFASARIPQAFAFRKAVSVVTPAKTATSPQPRGPKTPPARQAPPPSRRPFTPTPAKASIPATAAKRPDLAQIRDLADRGDLTLAARACEEHLRHEQPTAEGWRLFGLLRDASGDLTGAADCYRKALYLDPTDRDALEHLALLLERTGDAAGAKRVNARAQRLQRTEAP